MRLLLGGAVLWAIASAYQGAIRLVLDCGYPRLVMSTQVPDPPLRGLKKPEETLPVEDEFDAFSGRWLSKQKIHSLSHKEQVFLMKGLAEKLRPYGKKVVPLVVRRTAPDEDEFRRRVLRTLL